MERTRVVVLSDNCWPPYRQEILCGRHVLVADEPVARGGLDAGASPWGYLLSSLGTCTAISIRRYCEHHAWPIERVMVSLEVSGTPRLSRITRNVRILGNLSARQGTRLAALCERTPVTRVLRGGTRIRTQLSVQRPNG